MRRLSTKRLTRVGVVLLLAPLGAAMAQSRTPAADTSLFEATFESAQGYADPFNEVDVDVVFTRDGQSWRVPAFWRGGGKWTVRFAPPAAGEYAYHLESTDRSNADLNGHGGKIALAAYSGTNALLRRGALRVSGNGRYFEHTDGTPFHWLGDMWYSSLSTRTSWADFKTLVERRKAQGFTVAHLAFMVPGEETAPSDPGYCNEGGCIWDPQFQRINPRYFDYADRRIRQVVDAGMVPVLFGVWRYQMAQMGVEKIKKHWRYIVARYGAYPVVWVLGGEIYEPPESMRLPGLPLGFPYGTRTFDLYSSGWTELARYVRALDPFKRLFSVHEIDPPYDVPLTDESLTDFDLFQSGHRGWPSLATAVAQLTTHYARTNTRKPLVVGELGWEDLGSDHLATFQRAAYWLSMLNGAAGYTYGNAMTGEAYESLEPLHRIRHSFQRWDEALALPGAQQISLGAALLRKYPWQALSPQPDWISPRGTTLLEPRAQINGFDIDLIRALVSDHPPPESMLPAGEWAKKGGTIRLPYAAGIPGKLRIIYIPSVGFALRTTPTVLGLERGVRYRAYYWDPALGIQFDLGFAERPQEGALIAKAVSGGEPLRWEQSALRAPASARTGSAHDTSIMLVAGQNAADLRLDTDIDPKALTGLILRYLDPDNFLAALYAPDAKRIYFVQRQDGVDSAEVAVTSVESLANPARLSAEVRGSSASVSLSDGARALSSPIIDISIAGPGRFGILGDAPNSAAPTREFAARLSVAPANVLPAQRKLFDARGTYRGSLEGPVWGAYGQHSIGLLDAWRPEAPPTGQDWVLVMEAQPR